jgi:hypothetical protein
MSFVVKAAGILQQPATVALLCLWYDYIFNFCFQNGFNFDRNNGISVRNMATLKDSKIY